MGGSVFVSRSSSLPGHSWLCQNRDVNLIDCIICTKRGELIRFRVGHPVIPLTHGTSDKTCLVFFSSQSYGEKNEHVLKQRLRHTLSQQKPEKKNNDNNNNNVASAALISALISDLILQIP